MPVFRLKPGGREPAPGIFLEAEKFFVPPVCSKLLEVFLCICGPLNSLHMI